MLNAVIIEDEKPAQENLISALQAVENNVQVAARLSSVKESIEYLSKKNEIDLIFSDVQLPDGISFEIFTKQEIHIPVIFTTSYDEFMLNAFECNGIDYLLKPIQKEELKKALNKYKMLQHHFTGYHPLKQLFQYVGTNKKKRLLVKKGIENISLLTEDIVLFYTENKIVYVLDKNGKKYLSDKNLTELDEYLDAFVFFRANRQYIVNINFIRSFKAFEKVKLQIELTLPELNHYVIVSQEMAPQFKEWIQNY